MPHLPKKPLLFAASHFVVLGLGAWWASQATEPDPSAVADHRNQDEVVTMKGNSPAFRVSSSRLLDAYDFGKPFYLEAHPREEDEPYVPPEERAALISDFEGALQEQLDSLNQDRGVDSFYAQALISRWMSLDPRAAMLFVGRMELRTGWGDPWPALFKNPCQLSGLELFEVIRDSWHPNNRREGLRALAPFLGRSQPGQLDVVLASMEGDPDEARRMLDRALPEAKAGDLSTWIETLSGLPEDWKKQSFDSLAKALVPSRVPASWLKGGTSSNADATPSLGDLRGLLSQSTGTPLESAMQERFARLEAAFADAMAPVDPPSAASDPPPPSAPAGWTYQKNARPDFQRVMLAEIPLSTALSNQFRLIESGLAEGQQAGAYRQILGEALLIDPRQALAFAGEQVSPEEIQKAIAAATSRLDQAVPPQPVAKLFTALVDTPYWDEIPNRNSELFSLIHSYDRYHADLAKQWLRTIPGDTLLEIKNSQHSWKHINALIDEALAQ